jgi:hypothetical protein
LPSNGRRGSDRRRGCGKRKGGGGRRRGSADEHLTTCELGHWRSPLNCPPIVTVVTPENRLTADPGVFPKKDHSIDYGLEHMSFGGLCQSLISGKNGYENSICPKSLWPLIFAKA